MLVVLACGMRVRALLIYQRTRPIIRRFAHEMSRGTHSSLVCNTECVYEHIPQPKATFTWLPRLGFGFCFPSFGDASVADVGPLGVVSVMFRCQLERICRGRGEGRRMCGR
jgi:hypothetical protein